MLLELDAELLLALWPASRIVAGRRVCHHLRETLCTPRTAVLRTGKVWQPPKHGRRTVAADLCRLQNSHVELLAASCRLPVESVVEGMLLACQSGWTALSTLDLSSADVGGDVCDALVEVLSRSTHLKKIDISDNELGPTGSGKVAEALGLCPELTSVSLSRVGLSSAAWQLGATLSKLVRLEHLDVSGNMLEDGGAEKLAKSLALCTRLNHLDVGYNLVAERGGLAVAEALASATALTHLSLCRNRIGALAAEALLGGRGGRLRGLVRLDLRYILSLHAMVARHGTAWTDARKWLPRYNEVGDSGVVALAGALAGAEVGAVGAGRGGGAVLENMLEKIDMAYNMVGEAGAEALARRLLPACPRLRKLNLKYNAVGDAGAAALAAAAAEGGALEVLVLCYNGVGDGGATGVAEALGARGSGGLRHVHLRSNRVGARGLGALAGLAGAGRCAGLRCLDVYGNAAHHAALPPQPRPLLRSLHHHCNL